MSTSDDDEIWALFRDEATEALEQLAAIVEASAETREPMPARERSAALRVLHNIKGAARMAGAVDVETIAHAMEEALTERSEPIPAPILAARLRDGMGLVSRYLAGETPTQALRLFVSPTPSTPSTKESDDDAPLPSNEALSNDQARARAGTTTVRVEAARLDALVQFAGEIMAVEARTHERQLALEQAHLELMRIEPMATGELGKALRDLGLKFGTLLSTHRKDMQRFKQLGHEWTDSIKRARLSPLAGVVPQWRRTVAETAHALGRQARLVANVGDIEIDRQILDALRDPMMHLLRNAVDHGIEPPDVRERLGKPHVGTIRIEATAPQMMIEIEVSDDGRGMNPQRIAARAVERRLASEEHVARLSDADLLELIFLSGFSTTESAHHVSGRGVGLDVVKQRLTELGGHVRIAEPTLGGSTFRLSVPATLISSKGLLVRAARTAFVLPMAYVARTFRVPATAVRELDDMMTVEDSLGEPLRLRWLSSLMREPRRPDSPFLPIVIISNGESRIGLVIDEMIGEVEAVTKRLPWNIPRVPGIAGAMILGTGQVALVLDIMRFFRPGLDGIGAHHERPLASNPPRKRRILVVDDSLTSRTLERNILTTAGYAVDTANDGEMGWQALTSVDYDLLVTDVQMPNVDGIELVMRVRADTRLRHLPVILVTSLDRSSDRARGTAAGADEYIVKGRFDQRQLLEAVARHL